MYVSVETLGQFPRPSDVNYVPPDKRGESAAKWKRQERKSDTTWKRHLARGERQLPLLLASSYPSEITQTRDWLYFHGGAERAIPWRPTDCRLSMIF